MSAIKKMNRELELILGREPTIHEQIDILILSVVKERITELELAYQMNPNEEYKELYLKALQSLAELQERNPEIFGYTNNSGGGDDYI